MLRLKFWWQRLVNNRSRTGVEVKNQRQFEKFFYLVILDLRFHAN